MITPGFTIVAFKPSEIPLQTSISAFFSFDKRDLESMKKINVEGTANMVNVALDNNIKKFCYVSTIAAIGLSTNKYTDEETEWVDATPLPNRCLKLSRLDQLYHQSLCVRVRA